MAANGNLIFQDTNKATFVGANSNVVIDTVNASFGVGVDVNGPTSNLHVVGNAYVTSNLEVGTANLFVDTVNSRVGVGTTNPQAPLHIGDYTTGSAGEILRLSGSSTSNRHFKFLNEDDGVIGGAGANAIWVHDINSSFGQYAFRTNNTELMRIRNDGNVGIGTTTPEYPFDVRKSVGDIEIRLEPGSDAQGNESGIRFDATFETTADNGHRRAADLRVGYNGGAWGTEYMSFRVGTGGQNDTQTLTTERMRIAGNGNVGVGTTDPDSLLHVQHTTTNNAFIKANRHNEISSTKAIFAVSEYQMTGETSPGTIIGNHNRSIHIGPVFGAGNTVSSTDIRGIHIKSTGDVGIGTTTPSGKLEVYDTTNTKSLLNVRAGSGTGARTEINSGIRFDYNSIESYGAGGSSSANREYHIRFNTGRKMALFYDNNDLQFWWGGGGNYANRASVGNSAEFGFTFTGQHRNFIKDVPYRDVIDRQLGGLIVSANNNKYIKITGGIEKGSNAITQNESLPLLSLSSKALDKSCFGVISESEDPNTDRSGSLGMFRSFYDTEDGDKRVIINSVGEGAIWVTNINGNLESGDYITTSNVAGYGQKQDSDSLKNYTVAKITMDCDFNPVTQPIQNIKKGETGENILDEHGQIQWEDDPSGATEKAYKIRYLDADGNITDEANHVHKAAFVGCTYHCG